MQEKIAIFFKIFFKKMIVFQWSIDQSPQKKQLNTQKDKKLPFFRNKYLLCSIFFKPSAAQEMQHKDNRAEEPVCRHTDPNSHNAQSAAREAQDAE